MVVKSSNCMPQQAQLPKPDMVLWENAIRRQAKEGRGGLAAGIEDTLVADNGGMLVQSKQIARLHTIHDLAIGGCVVHLCDCHAILQGLAAANVSQVSNAPDCSPLRNQRTRWAELPWVKELGVT